jgi:ABC-2 type transport system permease protein
VLTAVPFAFAGFVPATYYMDRPGWATLALVQPLVGLACIAAGYGFWRVSLRRYASSGS